MQTISFDVHDMTCGGCTSNVTHALKAVTGVSHVKMSLANGEATVQFDERLTSPNQLKLARQGAGYGVDATNTAHSHQGKVATVANARQQHRRAKSHGYE